MVTFDIQRVVKCMYIKYNKNCLQNIIIFFLLASKLNHSKASHLDNNFVLISDSLYNEKSKPQAHIKE